jgi:plastocyanin
MRCVCLVVLFAAVQASAAEWVTLKGQVVWPKGEAIPKRGEYESLKKHPDKAECEKNGAVLDDSLIINEKSRGVKNVFVYLRPDEKTVEAKLTDKDIHPDLLKVKPVTHEPDQPCCLFAPKNLALRAGDFINFKNSSKIAHNVKLDAEAPSPTFNKTVAAGGAYQDPKPFAAQRSQIEFSCSIHPWMKGKIMVFDHPYFAVTDDDGKFEIKNAPAGKYRIVYHGDRYHKGKEGRFGWEIMIKGVNGVQQLEPLEFVIPPEPK